MKMYEISEKDIAKLENVVSYFKYHNKNLTKNQDYQLDQLEDVVGRLYDIFSGYADDEYKEVSIEALESIMEEKYVDEGKYLAFDADKNVWIAYDNANGDGFVEEFFGKRQAIDWLSDY